jgi:hypothetical protein
MEDFWGFVWRAEVGLLILGALWVIIAFAIADIAYYAKHGWQKHSLPENEWRRLQLHLQTLEKLEKDRHQY